MYLLWRNWGLVWAVARKMIVEAMHRKLVLILLIFFVVLMLSLPFILKTEGSVKSQVQLVLLYSLVLAMVLLSLVAIFLSAASICSEVEQKQVHITDTKPLRRWQFLFGKWFGVVVMCMAVLFVMTAAAYVLVRYLSRPPDLTRMTRREAAKVGADYMELMDEVLIARTSSKALEPVDVTDKVEKEFQKMLKEGDVPNNRPGRRKVRERLRMRFLGEELMLLPGEHHEPPLRVQGLRPQEQGVLQIRFRAYTTAAQAKLEGRWFILHRKLAESREGKKEFRYEPVAMALPPPQGWVSGVLREFTIPASYVDSDGTFYLSYENLDSRKTVVFDGDQLVEVMQKEGEFLPNYYRAVFVLLCHIALLAALGLMAGSIFSFPVASLTVGFFVLVGLAGPCIASFIEPISAVQQYTPFEELVQVIWRGFLGAVLYVVPHFGAYNPLGDLTDGRIISWPFVASAGATMVCAKGGLALLIGMYLYGRRELARIIV
jgi:ABC-type transport system involved in multi-copper enzyme maturation permease subunit